MSRIEAAPGAADDAQLVIALRSGCPDALEGLYRRHAPAVVGTARRILRDPVRAEDVTQAVFLAIWEHPERYDPAKGSLRGLLVTMAHSRSVDLARSERARRIRDDRDASKPRTSQDVLDLVERGDVAERVHAALSELDEVCQRALSLAYFGGYSYRQVAVELGVPEGTAKARIRRGMDCLRSRLEPDEL